MEIIEFVIPLINWLILSGAWSFFAIMIYKVYIYLRDKRIQWRYDFLIKSLRKGSKWLELPSKSQILPRDIITTDKDKELHSRLIDLAIIGSSWTEFEKLVQYFNNKAVLYGGSDLGHNTDVFKKIIERKRRYYIHILLFQIAKFLNWIKRMKGRGGYFIRSTLTGGTLTHLELCFNPTGEKEDLRIVKTFNWGEKKYLH